MEGGRRREDGRGKMGDERQSLPFLSSRRLSLYVAIVLSLLLLFLPVILLLLLLLLFNRLPPPPPPGIIKWVFL